MEFDMITSRRILFVSFISFLLITITSCQGKRKANPQPAINYHTISYAYELPCRSSIDKNNEIKLKLPPGKIKNITIERTDTGRHCKIETELSTGIRMPGSSVRRGTMFPAEPGTTGLRKVVYPNKGVSRLDQPGTGLIDQNGTNPEETLHVKCSGGTGTCKFTVTVQYESFTINGFSYVFDKPRDVITGSTSKTKCHSPIPTAPAPNDPPNFTSRVQTKGFFAVAVFPTGACPVTVKFAGSTAPAGSYGSNPVRGLNSVSKKTPGIGTFNTQGNNKVMAYCTGNKADGCSFKMEIIPLKKKP